MLTMTAHSLAEFHELVKKSEQALLDGDKPTKRPDDFWYRGVDNGAYTLTPSLYRYRDPIEKEQLLFLLHEQSALTSFGDKRISWERVIHMQHHSIPTRLLDWTTNILIAVFFALTVVPINPCVYILNPLRLNRKNKEERLVTVPMYSDFDFERYFFGNPGLMFDGPLAIIPKVRIKRLIRQRGRFTVQGRKHEPLERQAPECIARINLSESSHTELREELARNGISARELFPDYEGVAQFVKSEARLRLIPYDESIASHIRHRLWERAADDLYALTHRDENKEPPSKGIAFCNLDETYISRAPQAAQMATWLKRGPPFLFITGEAGIGKTNFTLHTLLRHDDFQDKPSVFFSFKLYGSEQVAREEGIGELAGYLYDIMLSRRHSEQDRHVARQMLSEGDVVLALDGLDELARIRGVEAVEEVGRELEALFSGSPRARVIITCRDHVLTRLKGTGVLGKTKNQHEFKLSRFPAETVRNVLEQKLPNIPNNLIEMARVPLFYEMVRRARDHWPELIAAQDNRTKLEEVWFNVILRENRLDLDLRKLGVIAGRMLHDRSDLLNANSITADLKAILRVLSSYPFALFVEELQETYSFSHQSLREFVLAWCVTKEIKSRSPDLLKSSGSFDYEGHEFYDRVRDILDIKHDVIDQLGCLLDSRDLDEGQQNHLIRNLFEILGELTPGESGLVEKIAETALPFLKPTRTDAGYITYKTRYNIVRCLERIHWSAPRPYIDHIKDFRWWRDPYHKPAEDEYHVYAYAIRGFHRPRQEATSTPPIIYRRTIASKQMRDLETKVSDHLMAVIESLKEYEIPEDAIFLGINCTLALIRWLPQKPDLDRIDTLMQWRHMDWRMKQNLFHALFLRYGARIPTRFRNGGLFCDAGELENASDEVKEAFRMTKLGPASVV